MGTETPLLPVRNYVIAFKTLAFISFILGLFLISTCFWVLISFTDRADEEETNPTASGFRLLTILVKQQAEDADTNARQLLNTYPDNHTHTHDNYQPHDNNTAELQQNFLQAWNCVSPYFQGACGLALVLGLVQLVSCMAILTSSTKGASKQFRRRLWKALHCFLILFLLLCILIPVSVDKSLKDGGIAHHLEALSLQLKRNYARHTLTLDTDDVDNMMVLYVGLVVDAGGLVILLGIGHFVLKHFAKLICDK